MRPEEIKNAMKEADVGGFIAVKSVKQFVMEVILHNIPEYVIVVERTSKRGKYNGSGKYDVIFRTMLISAEGEKTELKVSYEGGELVLTEVFEGEEVDNYSVRIRQGDFFSCTIC